MQSTGDSHININTNTNDSGGGDLATVRLENTYFKQGVSGPLSWLILSFVYFIVATISLSLAYEQSNTSPVWPPTGVAVAALFYLGPKAWPGVFLGAMATNLTTGVNIATALGIAFGNTLECITVFYLLKVFASYQPIQSPKQISIFVACLFIGCAIGATIGVSSLLFADVINNSQFSILWLTWWMGDFVGGLTLTPFLLSLKDTDFEEVESKLGELICIALITASLLFFVFTPFFDFNHLNAPLSYILIPLAMWSAFSFHQFGAGIFTLFVSAAAITGTINGYGPFINDSINDSLLMIQSFMGTMSISALILAAGVRQKADKIRDVRDRNRQLNSIDEERIIQLKNTNKQLALEIEERQRASEALQALLNATNQVSHEDLLSRAVKSIASIYSTKFAFVGTFKDDDKSLVSTRFVWANDNLSTNFDYQLEGTPCADVLDNKVEIISANAAELYPKDTLLIDMGIESYFGAPLITQNGETIGIMAVMDTNPLHVQDWSRPILALYADRIAIEIERHRIEQEKKKSEEHLYYLAHYDPLTGLLNRSAFQEQIRLAILQSDRSDTPLAVIFLDLDHFKNINDASGHATGDSLLKIIAQRIKNLIRKDDVVARLGGDEFVIQLTSHKSNEDLASIAKKLISEVSRPIKLEKIEAVVSASLGISVYPQDGKGIGDLLQNADTAMYRAKQNGRNNYQFFTQDMNDKAKARLAIENDLRKAIENEQLCLYYQPRINVNQKRVIAVEALVRWRHPDKGLLFPNHFIPVAEESGLIRQLDDWVLRQACKQIAIWDEQGLGKLSISVNVSAQQFISNSFFPLVKSLLNQYSIDAYRLELELTERAFLDDNDECLGKLNELKSLGLKLAIDDFGTGYSSLSYLRHLPIDSLKIDRSFIGEMQSHAEDATIVRAIVALAQNLQLEVVAEGVENKMQMEFLQANGCEDMQGFYFSKAIESLQIIEFIKNFSAD